MTKVHFYKLISNIGSFINSQELERLSLLVFGILQSRTVNISIVNDHISLEETGCKNIESQYKYLLKPSG